MGDTAPAAGRTPRERWETAVAARPLETPRPLPVAFHAMASALTGRARPPLFTTGPNTRHALASAGALGATTGTVVHLPAAPTSGPAVSAVLAHELTHTRSPVRRPRFFLGGASALLDDDERQALSAGRARLGQAVSAGTSAVNAATSAVDAATSAVDAATSAVGAGTSAVGAGRSAVGAGTSALSTGAGIVDSLPVGGGGLGGVSEVATRAARAAIIEASGSPMGGAFSGLQGAAGDAFSGLQSAAGGAVSGLQGSAGDAFSGLQNMAGGAVSGLQGAAGGAVSGLQNAAGSAMSGLEHAAGSASGIVSDTGGSAMNAVNTAAGGGGGGQALNPDQVVEIVERRLLREIERRGGRWSGIF